MNAQAGYFEIPSLRHFLAMVDRLMHPFVHQTAAQLRGKATEVRWTARADRAMTTRARPLIAEMQLYFSCVVKKRVLFHEACDIPLMRVNDKLQIGFRPVESTACDPEAFARGYPVKGEFDSPAAARLRPSALQIDYKNGQWLGEFFI